MSQIQAGTFCCTPAFGLPDTDPAIAPGTEPMPGSYRARGGWNAADPEEGCRWNGLPFHCNDVKFILETQGVVGVEINDRSPGGFRLHAMTENAIRVRETTTRTDVIGVCDAGDPDCIPSTELGTPYTHFDILWSTTNLIFAQKREDTSKIRADIKSARSKLTEKCINNLQEFLLGAVKKKFGFQDGSEELEHYASAIIDMDAMLGNLSTAAITSSAIHRSEDVTDAIYSNKTVATFKRTDGDT